MKRILIVTGLLIVFSGSLTTLKAQKPTVVEIQTSAQCDMCKGRLESNLAFEKGITKVELDMETKKISVSFKSSKTNVETIKGLISKLGYDADDIKADATAYEELPGCCKKPEDRGNHSHH